MNVFIKVINQISWPFFMMGKFNSNNSLYK